MRHARSSTGHGTIRSEPRYINNEREMTFAFMVDAGRYITRLGETFASRREG